jgi:curved DNA-binding protein CbpA
MDHYETLGVPRDADQDTIKKAYRKKAMKKHPDRGGSEDEFYPIQRAYSVLSDQNARKRYDETGQDQETADDVVSAQLGQLFLALVEKHDVEYTNIVQEMKRILRETMRECDIRISEQERAIAKKRKAIKRITRKKGENILAAVLQHKITEHERNIRKCEQEKEIGTRMLEMVDEYDYQADVKPSMFWVHDGSDLKQALDIHKSQR